ncbi:MAG: GlxA family transcriptional regulator, partial [Pseudomonadota bacterium]
MDKLDQHHHKSHRIGLLLLPDFAMMSYAALVEPMRAANILADRELYKMINIGATRAAIASSGAAMVTPQTSISDVPKLDYLFVIAGGNPANYANKRV